VQAAWRQGVVGAYVEVLDERLGEVNRGASGIGVIEVPLDQFCELHLRESRRDRLFRWREPCLLRLFLVASRCVRRRPKTNESAKVAG